jgi:hypothetical protein
LKKREQDAGSIGVRQGGTGAGYNDESFEESEYGSGEWEEEGDEKEGEAARDELAEEYDANDFEVDELNDLAGETAALESEAVLEAYLSAQVQKHLLDQKYLLYWYGSTCFTGTQVEILTPEDLLQDAQAIHRRNSGMCVCVCVCVCVCCVCARAHARGCVHVVW